MPTFNQLVTKEDRFQEITVAGFAEKHEYHKERTRQ